jgi:flagellar capping protein FliD
MGVLGGGISINGPSGIDTASLVEQLTALEQQKVTTIQNEKTKYQTKIDVYSKLKSVLATLAEKANLLKTSGDFDLFKSASSNKDIVTLKGGVGAVESQYDISVYQLARNEKMMSKPNQVKDQAAPLSGQGIAVGDISIDGTTITVTATDTIQDLRMKINSATDVKGNKLNVSASVMKISDTDYRLVLTAKNTGAAGINYQDVGTATTLKDLGIITGNGADNKGNVAQVLQSDDDIQTIFDGLTAGKAIQYSGKDRDGNVVTNTYIKPAAGTSINDFLSQIKTTFHDMVDVSIGTGAQANKLIITDKVQGTSQLSLSSLTIDSTSHTMSAATIGDEGAGVLSSGKDAYFNLDGMALTSKDNEADGVIAGVTVELHKVSATDTVQASISRDTDAIQKKVQDLLDAYNALATFVSDNTKMADPNDSNSKSGNLAGDMTAKSLLDQVRNQLSQSAALFGGSYNSLAMFGVKSDPTTGQMSIDSTQFAKVITNNFDDVEKFFVSTGISDNKNIALGRFTKDSQSGTYTLDEPDADHFRIQFGSDPTWYTSDVRVGDIITFSSGPAKGLSLTAPTGTIGAGKTAPFTFSKGLGDRISELSANLNDPANGMITIHQNSLQDSIKVANDRVTAMQKRVDDYHDRMVKQFSAMEQALQSMKNQASNMLAALGTSSSS